jgi:hypothetical protein
MKNKNLRNKAIGGAVVVSMATTSSIYTVNKINNLKEENSRLQSQIDVNEKKAKAEVVDTTFEALKEINAKNTKLIIYEAESKGYSKTIKNDALIDMQATLNTSYSYMATIDLSTSKIVHAKGHYMVIVDLSNIKLDTISIGPMDIKYDLNLLNRWKGKTQSELTGAILTLATEDIEAHVNDDFTSNINLIKARVKTKIYSIYAGIPVEVIFTGENN